jgi:hypothetical protein
LQGDKETPVCSSGKPSAVVKTLASDKLFEEQENRRLDFRVGQSYSNPSPTVVNTLSVRITMVSPFLN